MYGFGGSRASRGEIWSGVTMAGRTTKQKGKRATQPMDHGSLRWAIHIGIQRKRRTKGNNIVNGTVGPPIICTDQKVNVQFVANYPTTNNLSHFFLIWPIDDDANSMLVGGFTLSILSKLNDNNSVCRWREIKRPPPSLKIYFCIYVAKHIYLGGGGREFPFFQTLHAPAIFGDSSNLVTPDETKVFAFILHSSQLCCVLR